MKAHRMLTIAAAFTVFLAAPAAQATLYYEADFENPPYAAGNILTQGLGWAQAYSASRADWVATAGGGAYPLPANGDQYLRMTKTNASETGIRNVFTVDPITVPFRVEFMMGWSLNANQDPLAAGNDLVFFIQDTGNTSNFHGMRVGFRIDDDGYMRLHSRTGDDYVYFGASGQHATQNTWFKAVMDIRPDGPSGSKYDVSIYDASDTLIGSHTDLAARGSFSQADRIGLRLSGSPIGTSFYVDDILIIPEPSTLLLLGPAAALLLIRRRARR